MGLNEQITDNPTMPKFFTELRRSIFAQIYSDDKNMAVFLGRPPRLNRTFCCFQLPSSSWNGTLRDTTVQRPLSDPNRTFFGPDDQVDYVTGLRWTACCASLKEDILEVLQEHDTQSEGVMRRFV